MDIKVGRSKSFYQGGYHQFYNFDVTVDHGRISEGLGEEEAHRLVVGLVEDVILHDCWQSEVVGKLIEAGVISHEMILEYVDELGEE